MDEKLIQKIRIFDFLVLGPVMIYAGYTYRMNSAMKFIMIASGIGTILLNYFEYKKREN